MKIIKSIEELERYFVDDVEKLVYKDDGGIKKIELIDDDFKILCDIKTEKSIYIRGSLYIAGSLETDGDLIFEENGKEDIVYIKVLGNLKVGKDLISIGNGEVSALGEIDVSGDIEVNWIFGRNITAKGHISVGGCISSDEDIVSGAFIDCQNMIRADRNIIAKEYINIDFNNQKIFAGLWDYCEESAGMISCKKLNATVGHGKVKVNPD